jgi:hypothetical protein
MLFLVCSDSVAVAATNFAFGNFFVERLYAPAIANASADVEQFLLRVDVIKLQNPNVCLAAVHARMILQVSFHPSPIS